MKTVMVMAANLKQNDIYNGRRIKGIHKYVRRIRSNKKNDGTTDSNSIVGTHKLAYTGVLLVTSNPNGNRLDVYKFPGHAMLKVKRPKKNYDRTKHHVSNQQE